MALSPTTRAQNSVGSGALASSTFTPSNNSLLVVYYSGQRDGSATPTVTPSGGGLAYTQQALIYDSSSFSIIAALWTAPVVTGASMSVSFSTTNTRDASSCDIVDWTGYNTASPVGLIASAAGASRSGAYSLSLGGTSGADSYVAAIAASEDSTNGNTVAAGTGWTTVTDSFVQRPDLTFLHWASEYRLGALSNADFDAVTTSFSWAAAAMEIKASPVVRADYSVHPKVKLRYRALGRF